MKTKNPRRDELWARANTYLAKSNGSESLTEAEERDWQSCVDELGKIDARAAGGLGDLSGLPAADGLPGATVARAGGERVLGRSESVADWSRRNQGHLWRGDDTAGMNLDRYCRGLMTGDWVGAETERRAASEGTDSAGGHLVPTPLASNIIDLARNRMRVMQAGARTVPMETQTLKVARLTQDPTAAWRAEHAAIAEDDVALDAVTFTARSLAVMVKASLEVIEDTEPAIGNTITDSMANSMALELDRVALRGSGTAPEPRGVLNQVGVTLNAGVGNLSYAKLLSLGLAPLLNANHEASGVILAPTAEVWLQGLVDGDGQPLRPPQMVADTPRYQTNQVPTDLGGGSDESEVYVADWSQLMVGIRTDLRIIPLRERFMETGEVAFIAWMRADVQLSRPAAFNVLSGVTAPA